MSIFCYPFIQMHSSVVCTHLSHSLCGNTCSFMHITTRRFYRDTENESAVSIRDTFSHMTQEEFTAFLEFYKILFRFGYQSAK